MFRYIFVLQSSNDWGELELVVSSANFTEIRSFETLYKSDQNKYLK